MTTVELLREEGLSGDELLKELVARGAAKTMEAARYMVFITDEGSECGTEDAREAQRRSA